MNTRRRVIRSVRGKGWQALDEFRKGGENHPRIKATFGVTLGASGHFLKPRRVF